jgi:hypothetical protein
MAVVTLVDDHGGLVYVKVELGGVNEVCILDHTIPIILKVNVLG